MTVMSGSIFTFEPKKKTLMAWKPLEDCISILFIFQNSDIEDDGEELYEWKLYWIAGIAALRIIGHVLDKVDSEKSAEHKAITSKWWQDLKSDRENNAIFWEFIEKERNSLLKTYTFGAKLAHDDEGFYILFGDDGDAFQLFREAVYWWAKDLIKIEDLLPNLPDIK